MIMKKVLSIVIIALLLVLGLYHSVYFEKLDEKKEQESIKDFNPSEKVDYFWTQKLDDVLESALDLHVFNSRMTDDLELLIRQHGKGMGITSTYCFLVKGMAVFDDRSADELSVEITNNNVNYSLQTKYIFGNTARDAVGFFNLADFENMMDFNAVAAELNKRILEKEIAKLDSLSPGHEIAFIGAVAVNSESIQDEIDIIPLKIENIQ